MSEALKSLGKILVLFMLSTNAFSYVHMHGKKQRIVQWPSSVRTINFSFLTSNPLGLDDSEVRNIIDESTNEWNNKSAISVRAQQATSVNQKGINEIYFSNDPSLFNGSGVIGVAMLLFKDNTSEIVEVDIVINENANQLTGEKTDDGYLGNVITHEIGHALGLGHSLVSGATMFYVLNFGQYELDGDDKAGIFSLYPDASYNKSEISGSIIGGKNLIPIFGTHVQAFSRKTGKVAAASISETNGRFKIMGLDPEDSYYLYSSAAENLGLSSRYLRARRDFCENSQNYRGSFFQSCHKSLEGYPQEVVMDNRDKVDVGNVTVRCALDVPAELLEANSQTAPFVFTEDLTDISAKGFVGYFTEQEVSEKRVNEFEIDLTNHDYSGLAGELFLEIKIRNQAFHSPYGIEVSYRDGLYSPHFEIMPDYFNSLDQTLRLPIDKSDSSVNLFRISLRPTDLLNAFGAEGPSQLYYPGGIAGHETMYFYLVDVSLVKKINATEFTHVIKSNPSFTDNSSCTDAKNTYRLSDSYLLGDNDQDSRKIKNGSSCGSIDLEGKGPGGPGGGFFIGLIFIVLLANTKTAYSKLCLSKHVGKLA